MTELEELFSLDKALEDIESRDWPSYYRRAIAVVRELQSDIEAMDRDRKLIAEKLDEVKESLRTAQNARDALRPQVEDLKKPRDAALAANCNTTTVDQLKAAEAQLAKETGCSCEIGVTVGPWVSYCAKIYHLGGATVLGRGSTLVEAVANTRKPWKNLPETLKKASEGKALDTTLEQIDTVARQLSAETMHAVEIIYETECEKGGRPILPSFRATVYIRREPVGPTITAPTLPELAANVRRWWAERHGKEAVNA